VIFSVKASFPFLEVPALVMKNSPLSQQLLLWWALCCSWKCSGSSWSVW